MCLYVDKNYHPGMSPKARVAQQDILVYKVLDKTPRGAYRSPYQGTKWTLGGMKKSSLHCTYSSYGSWTVRIGLHSCITRSAAKLHTYCASDIYPAIIPKGSRVWFGTSDEIASDKLIVYRDKAELVKARGAIGPAVHRNKIAI